MQVAVPTDRSQFINRTYTHLLAAIFLFAGVEFWLFSTPYAEQLALFMLQKSWLAVLGAFVVVSWVATHIAHSVESKGAQYAALVGFVVAEAINFIPMFYIALAVDPAINEYSVAITLGAFVSGPPISAQHPPERVAEAAFPPYSDKIACPASNPAVPGLNSA